MFNIGDRVVYPMHGAGIIEAIEEKEILGKKRKYYIMKMPLGEMKVMIPLDNVEDIGLREIISLKEVDQVVAVLNDDISKMPKNWNRRYRANMDKIKSGDIYEVAMVVRNLTLRDREKGLSTGERKMLANAKQILISEIVLARGIEEKVAEDIIDTAIQ
ncbi:CarD family transcriptional regulator [Crassaminicella profunda]|uniref:CarD family transcriptional regulator n=1 Tax=Crassaminicella profunda TaxID=1286698 RepID=UPI001CA60AC1|nr:CarD family transcriptional regulator [Crassaminicella profunda]QZY54660.1 CarD family transcriptional regulator [Crassaminicella profunda]